MTWQEIIDLSRTISWWLSTSQLPDSTAVKYMNIWYHKVKREIIDLRQDFFWDIFKPTTTVVWQSEYSIPDSLTWNYKDMSKALAFSIKYESTWDYTPCSKKYPYSLDHDLEWYKTNQSQWEPFVHISDKSYFIYPAPLEAVTNWINIYWIKDLVDIDENTVEADIFDWKIPTDYHYIIAYYVRYMYFMSRWPDFKNDKREAKFDFDEALEEITDWLWERDMSILYKKAP